MQNCLPPAPSGRLRLQPLVKPGEAPTDSEGTSHPMSRISDGSAEGRIALAVPQGPGTPDDGPAQENSKSAQAPPITPTPQPEGLRPGHCLLAAPHRRGLSASLPVGARCHRPEPEPSMEQQPGPGARLATMQSGRAPACQWTAQNRASEVPWPHWQDSTDPGPPPAHRRGMARRGITRTARVLDRGALATSPSGSSALRIRPGDRDSRAPAPRQLVYSPPVV